MEEKKDIDYIMEGFRNNRKRQFDFNFFESLNDYQDNAKKLTYKLLVLISYINRKYVAKSEFAEIEYYTNVFYNYFCEIIEKKRDFIFDDSYLIIFIVAKEVMRRQNNYHHNVISNIGRALEQYTNCSNEALCMIWGQYISFLSKLVRDNPLAPSSRSYYKCYFNDFFNVNNYFHSEVLKRFITNNLNSCIIDYKFFNSFIDNYINNPKNSGVGFRLTFIEFKIISGYCFINNCWNKLADYVQKLKDNCEIINDIIRANGLDHPSMYLCSDTNFYSDIFFYNEDFDGCFVSLVIDEIINKKTMIIK